VPAASSVPACIITSSRPVFSMSARQGSLASRVTVAPAGNDLAVLPSAKEMPFRLVAPRRS